MVCKDVSLEEIAEISSELQKLQKLRAWHMKTRIMFENRLVASAAGLIGYHSGMKEKDREASFTKARKLITEILDGYETGTAIDGIVLTTEPGIQAQKDAQKGLEGKMTKLVTGLPTLDWVKKPDQKGFGQLSFAVLIGETGDLNNYENPAKVWRRMGCAPFQKDGETLMGSTWRRKSGPKTGAKMSASDWEEYGYSPRRRSIAYLISEGIVKLNGDGPYRKRYNTVKKESYDKHPDWTWNKCTECKNEPGLVDECTKCLRVGFQCLRAHRHASLLATKLLLKNLWFEWTEAPFVEDYWKS